MHAEQANFAGNNEGPESGLCIMKPLTLVDTDNVLPSETIAARNRAQSQQFEVHVNPIQEKSRKARRTRTQSQQCDGGDITVFAELRELYNEAESSFSDNGTDLSTNKSLLERESIFFCDDVRKALKEIWDWIDIDRSGDIDLDEYKRL
jgi:hypothetical protein